MFNSTRFGAPHPIKIAQANTVRLSAKRPDPLLSTEEPLKPPPPVSYELPGGTKITEVPGGGLSVESGGNMYYVNDTENSNYQEIASLVGVLKRGGFSNSKDHSNL